MFDNYRRVLHPASIVDVVDAEILQALMQAFFYRQRTGLTMLYDDGWLPGADGPILHSLDPFAADSARNRDAFHPFCAAFRKDSAKDSLCRGDDERIARLCYQGRCKPGRIPCHMGLIDLVYPIQIGNRVRAVLFAGQRVPTWDGEAMYNIEKRIREEVTEPTVAEHLLTLLPSSVRPDMTHYEEVNELEQQFLTFGETFQKTVTALYEAKRGEAVHEAVVEVTDQLNQVGAPTSSDWFNSVEVVLAELESVCGGLPLVFLVRLGSRYIVKAVSPKAARVRSGDASVVGLARLPSAVWTFVSAQDSYYKELSRAIPGSPAERRGGPSSRVSNPRDQDIQLYRFDTTSARDVSLSIILLVAGRPEPHARMFLAASARAMAYPSQVNILFARLNDQREQFVKQVTFTGHTLKTPITTALFQLRKLQQFADGVPIPKQEASSLARKLRKQLSAAVYDAMGLTTAAREPRDWVEIGELLRELIPGFQAMGAERFVTVKYDDNETYFVYGVKAHLRIAFNNLLDNAVKYSFSHKEIRIEVTKPVRDEILIEISNYGVGFSEQLKSRLFTYGQRIPTHDPRLNRQGSGLGLLHAKEFIEGCDGSIDIESHKIKDLDPTAIRYLTIVKVLLPIRLDKT